MRHSLVLLAFASSSCVIVASSPCSDAIQDGTETDVDCGGSTCTACADTLNCSVDADCESAFCAGGRCTPLPSTIGAETYSIDAPSSLSIVPGVQAGYFITANTGGSYRLVWTGDAASSGVYREFQGTVFTTGTLSGFSTGCGNGSCALESDDIVSSPVAVTGGTRIDFDAITTTGLDGFDFVSSVEPVFFDLVIDGQRIPSAVYFSSSGQAASSATMPFGLTTQ